jgi:hypothetical protein
MKSSYRWVIVASFAWGAASDRFGTRIVVLTGASLLGTGLLLASRAALLIQFQLTYGPLAGGWIFDTFNSYSRLYLGSFGVALGAAAIVLAFPPLTRDALQPA